MPDSPVARLTVSRTFVRMCKRRRRRSKIADSMGADWTGLDLLVRTLILRRLIRRRLGAERRCLGLLLPPSAPAVAANMAAALDRRVAVNLNYTSSSAVLNHCIEQAEIGHVLTSRRVLSKLDLTLDAELVPLEDLAGSVTWRDKLIAAAQAWCLPAPLLERRLGLHAVRPDDLLTIVFTSGSTGQPKGVMLSYGNVHSNVDAVDQLIHITPRDVLVGVLPFFHSFGYSITMWTVASLDVKGVYHFNPLDGRGVGRLVREHRGTLLLATPTFLRAYLRRCDREMFATLDVVITGAERLSRETADAFEKKFGIRPVEGYGTTELSPLVSVNIPPSRSRSGQRGLKEGSVGRPIPGVQARVVDLATGRPLGPNQTGMLQIKGPNVMLGYLKRPDLTREVVHDGWYTTGDLAQIDEDGFITITGRVSRFSKIGGEMVPHVEIEDRLEQIINAPDDQRPMVAVTGVPDPKKGERLVVLHKPLSTPPEELSRKLAEQGLPRIYIPSPDSYFQVDELPVLGSGKLDLNRIRQIALERCGVSADA